MCAPARGKHVHWIIVDDPFEDKMRMTHKAIKDYFFKTISNMILEEATDCHIILIATPQNKSDLLHDSRIKDSDDWAYHRYPAIINYEKKLVSWPEYWPFEKLMKRKSVIGDLEFEQEFQLNPLDSSQGQLFPADLMKAKSLDYTTNWQFSNNKLSLIMAVDPSFGTRDDCVFIIGYSENGILYPIHIDVSNGMNEDKFCEKLLEKQTKFNLKHTYIEKNSIQAILNRIKKLPMVIDLFSTTRDLKLEMIKKVLRNRFDRDNIKFPYMTEFDEGITNKILLQLNNLGFDKTGKLRALHGKDDMAIALSILSYYCMKNLIESYFCSGKPIYNKDKEIQSDLFNQVPKY